MSLIAFIAVFAFCALVNWRNPGWFTDDWCKCHKEDR